jgi:hypothetical protein
MLVEAESMKRIILGLIGLLAAMAAAVTLSGIADISGAARFLVLTGSVVIVVAVVDGLRSPSAPDAADDVVIDLRETPHEASEGSPAVASHGPITDDEVQALFMAALS